MARARKRSTLGAGTREVRCGWEENPQACGGRPLLGRQPPEDLRRQEPGIRSLDLRPGCCAHAPLSARTTRHDCSGPLRSARGRPAKAGPRRRKGLQSSGIRPTGSPGAVRGTSLPMPDLSRTLPSSLTRLRGWLWATALLLVLGLLLALPAVDGGRAVLREHDRRLLPERVRPRLGRGLWLQRHAPMWISVIAPGWRRVAGRRQRT